MKFFRRLGLILIIPLVILAFFIDIVVGDIMTGKKTTASEKSSQLKKLWIDLWHGNYT